MTSSSVSSPSAIRTPSFLRKETTPRSNDSPYLTRRNPGSTEAHFNSHLSSVPIGRGPVVVDVSPLKTGNEGKKFRFMSESLLARYQARLQQFEELEKIIQEHHSLQPSLEPFDLPRQHEVVAYGRICGETDSKPSLSSLYLEGSKEGTTYKVKLDVSHIEKSFVLIPGMVVAARGKNLNGNKFVASELFTPPPLPLPRSPPSLLSQFQQAPRNPNGDGISVVVAAGPFTTSDNLDFQPFIDLFQTCHRSLKPDVWIIMGPIISAENDCIKKGTAPLTAFQLFEEQMARIIEYMKHVESERHTTVVLIPSVKEVGHTFIFPQPPYSEETMGCCGQFRERFVCLSNPSSFHLNGILFSSIADDTLVPLSSVGVAHSSNQTRDRLGSLVEAMLEQRSFCPVYPPPIGFNLDTDSLSQMQFHEKSPDIMLMASNLKPFIKKVGGTLAINVGRLSKGTGGGTFAQLTIHPFPEKSLSGEEPVSHQTSERVKVEILRI